jgi:nitrate reductase cytochrome c-type subunit
MRDRGPIFAGLFIFVALFTFPLWRGALTHTVARQPELTLPAGQKDCVLPAEQMRKTHMQLLIQWREDKVRNGITTYTAYDGKQYSASLTGTCLKCHGDQASDAQTRPAALSSSPRFCETCHQYSGVSTPYCFDCHVNPKQATALQASSASLPERGPDQGSAVASLGTAQQLLARIDGLYETGSPGPVRSPGPGVQPIARAGQRAARSAR